MTEFEGSLKRASPQVKITVFGPEVFSAVALVLNGERRSYRIVEDVYPVKFYLDVSGRHLRVLALPFADYALGLDDELPSKRIEHLQNFRVRIVVCHQLSDAVTVSKVHKVEASHLSNSLNPSGQSHLLSCIAEPKLSASICPVHICDLNFSKNIATAGNCSR